MERQQTHSKLVKRVKSSERRQRRYDIVVSELMASSSGEKEEVDQKNEESRRRYWVTSSCRGYLYTLSKFGAHPFISSIATLHRYIKDSKALIMSPFAFNNNQQKSELVHSASNGHLLSLASSWASTHHREDRGV